MNVFSTYIIVYDITNEASQLIPVFRFTSSYVDSSILTKSLCITSFSSTTAVVSYRHSDVFCRIICVIVIHTPITLRIRIRTSFPFFILGSYVDSTIPNKKPVYERYAADGPTVCLV